MMPSAKTLYPGGRHFKAADLKGAQKFRISGVSVGKAGPKSTEDQLIVAFEGSEKDMVLNATNAGVMIERFGDDYTAWTGKEITIAAVPTQYQGQNVQGIRILG